MQIYSDGKNRVINGTFPKRFRLLNAGAEVPYLRTAKDAIRLSGELPIGLLDIEEVEQKKTAQPSKLDAASLAIINKGDFDRIDILNKKLAINQEQMSSQLSALTEHEATLANLETQNAQAIEDTKNSIVEMAVAVGKEIQADREALKQTAESFSSSLKDTGEILSLKIEAHEKAKNPHNITKATIGLDQVDNTPDIDKPVSKPVKKELAKKADKKQVDELSKKIEETGKKQDKIVKGLDRINWVGGVGGKELPSGGKEGQLLGKASNKDGDYKWVDPKSGIEIIRVDELPTIGKTSVLYLVPSNDPEPSNIYDEYIWAVQSDDTYAWEKIGSTEIDLSGYVKSVNDQTPDVNGNVSINEITSAERTKLGTINTIFTKVGGSDIDYDLSTIECSKESQTYGFEYGTYTDQSSNTFTGLGSQNYHVASSFAYGKINFTFAQDGILKVTAYCSGESTYDFGILSNLDQELSKTATADTTNKYSFSGRQKTTYVAEYDVTAGNHFITIKYKKDSSTDTDLDRMVITKIEFVSKSGWFVASYENPSEQIEIGNTPEVPVKDVQMQKDTSSTTYTTILEGKTAKIPKATTSAYGVVRPSNTYGTTITSGYLGIYSASSSQVQSKSSTQVPLTPARIHDIIKYGLGNYTGTSFTEAEKQKARETIGVDDAGAKITFVEWT